MSSKRTFSVPVFTPTALADATDITAGLGMHISSGGALLRKAVSEIYMGGHATSFNLQIMQFARNGVISGTKSALVAPNSDGPLDGASQAVATPQPGFITATVTQPQRSNSINAARLPLAFNAFGGIVRWVAPERSEWLVTGTTAVISETSLSAFTGSGGGAMSAYIIYENL